jgi:hypothetical protein
VFTWYTPLADLAFQTAHHVRLHHPQVGKLRNHLTEEPLEDVYTPYVKERFSIDLEALHSGRHGN